MVSYSMKTRLVMPCAPLPPRRYSDEISMYVQRRRFVDTVIEMVTSYLPKPNFKQVLISTTFEIMKLFVFSIKGKGPPEKYILTKVIQTK